jgi:hypothetical protein
MLLLQCRSDSLVPVDSVVRAIDDTTSMTGTTLGHGKGWGRKQSTMAASVMISV